MEHLSDYQPRRCVSKSLRRRLVLYVDWGGTEHDRLQNKNEHHTNIATQTSTSSQCWPIVLSNDFDVAVPTVAF